MYSFQRNKVYELTSSVFYSSLCLFRRNNYTFGVVSLGRLWNILYEKEPLQLCFTMLRRKAAVFLYQNLIMRCYVTILTEIYDDPTFFGSGPGFVNRTQSDPGFVNPVRSGPGFVNPIRSDPVQVLLTPFSQHNNRPIPVPILLLQGPLKWKALAKVLVFKSV